MTVNYDEDEGSASANVPPGLEGLAKFPKLLEAVEAALQTCEPLDEKSAGGAGDRRSQGQLPLFGDTHVLPNAFLRAALFPGIDGSRARRYLKKEKLFSVGGATIFFTGQQFDQTDLDVLLGILDIGHYYPAGHVFSFTAHSLLKALKRSTGGKDHEWLHSSLTRLSAGLVEIRADRQKFFGHLIEQGHQDDETSRYTLRLNPSLFTLFGLGDWSRFSREQRAAIGRNGTAKALHGYYASHAKPGAHRYDTLAAIAGLENKQRSDVKRKIIRAHEVLASDKCGFLKSYEAGPETISVEKASATPSQVRSLLKGARRGRPSASRARIKQDT